MIITPKSIMQKFGFMKEEPVQPVVEGIKINSEKPEVTVEVFSEPEKLDFSATNKELEILSIMSTLGGSCKHAEIANVIAAKGLSYYKQNGTWKESWTILQKLVKKGAVIKEDKTYKTV